MGTPVGTGLPVAESCGRLCVDLGRLSEHGHYSLPQLKSRRWAPFPPKQRHRMKGMISHSDLGGSVDYRGDAILLEMAGVAGSGRRVWWSSRRFD